MGGVFSQDTIKQSDGQNVINPKEISIYLDELNNFLLAINNKEKQEISNTIKNNTHIKFDDKTVDYIYDVIKNRNNNVINKTPIQLGDEIKDEGLRNSVNKSLKTISDFKTKAKMYEIQYIELNLFIMAFIPFVSKLLEAQTISIQNDIDVQKKTIEEKLNKEWNEILNKIVSEINNGVDPNAISFNPAAQNKQIINESLENIIKTAKAKNIDSLMDLMKFLMQNNNQSTTSEGNNTTSKR